MVLYWVAQSGKKMERQITRAVRKSIASVLRRMALIPSGLTADPELTINIIISQQITVRQEFILLEFAL